MTGEYDEEDYLQLSGLQHFLFCRRQWALIHVENQWAENLRTVDGTLLHARAHDETLCQKRGDVITFHGVRLSSRRLGVSGQCDVLEYHRSDDGVELCGRKGRWLPFPVEYKRGEPKKGNCDAAQLCAQAMCLEEMLCCRIEQGALFYGQTHRRLSVAYTPELRNIVISSFAEMHDLFRQGRTPRARPSKACNACSLKDVCIPACDRASSVQSYLHAHMGEST